MKQEQLQETWNQYFASKAVGFSDGSLQNKLVEHYSSFLHIVGLKMHNKHNQFTIDELTSMGTFGLYDAIANYDPERKVKFETYAMPRVRGAILDEIRKADWVPRLVRSNDTKLDIQRNIHESKAGRRLTDLEMANAMKISLDEYYGFAKDTTIIHSMDDNHTSIRGDKKLSIDYVEDKKSCLPGEKMVRKELFDKLMGKNFTPQERKIIWLYYIDDISMKEISQAVELSESRVSQMHADILKRLRRKADRNPEYFRDIWSFVGGFREKANV